MRRQRRPGRGPFLAAMGGALAIVIGCSPAPSPSRSPELDGQSPGATASPEAPAATPTRVPTATFSPPSDAITPSTRDVVIRVESWIDVGGWTQLGVFVYADGSMLDARGNGPPTVRALSAAGLARIVDRLRRSGLFTETRSIPFQPPPHGYAMQRVTYTDAGRTVSVTAANVAIDDEESRALIEIAETILEPESWFVATDWLDGSPRVHPYLPQHSRLTMERVALGADAWINPARGVERMNWPLSADPFAIGAAVSIPDQPNRILRCALIAGRDDAAVRSALAVAMSEGGFGGKALVSGWVMWADGPSLVGLTLRQYLPHEDPACTAADMPVAPTLGTAPRPSLVDVLQLGLDGWTPTGAVSLFVQVTNVRNDSQIRVDYYPDGSVLFYDPPAPMLGFAVRRLSASGQEALASFIEASGLLATSWSEEIPEEAPYDRMFSVVLPRPSTDTQGRPVSNTVILNASDRGSNATADEVVRFATRLLEPTTWLGGDAWIGGAGAVWAYRPPSVSISIEQRTDGEILGGPLVHMSAVAWPLSGTIETFGTHAAEYEPSEVRTAHLSPEEAIAVMRAFAAAGVVDGAEGSGYMVQGPTPEIFYQINLGMDGPGAWE